MKEKKNERLEIRLSTNDLEQIKNKVGDLELNSMSALILEMALKGRVIIFNSDNLSSCSYELNKIGVNINQITKILNTKNRELFEEGIENKLLNEIHNYYEVAQKLEIKILEIQKEFKKIKRRS